MTVKTFKPASPAQLKFVRSLSEDREVPIAGKDEGEAFVIARWEDCFSGKDVEMKEASQVIDWLKTLPRKAKETQETQVVAVTPAATPAEPLTEGVYVVPADGSIIKVKSNKAKTGLYAMAMMNISGERLTLTGEIVNWDWQYAAGLIRQIRPEWRMPAEVTHELGIRVGKCLWCGRKLRAASSVENSLGPICAKRFA